MDNKTQFELQTIHAELKATLTKSQSHATRTTVLLIDTGASDPLDTVTTTLAAVLDRSPDNSDIGLRFSPNSDDDTTPSAAVALGALTADRRAALTDALADSDTGSALTYDAITAAYRDAANGYRPGRPNSLLIVTTGIDDTATDDTAREELLDLAGPSMNEMHSSRGAAFGDFDNDGDVDVLIMNINEPPSLLRNDLSGNSHWLKVLLIGVDSNRSAIGAYVVATYGERRQAQAVLAQSSYLSVNDRRLHFGLGSETLASLEIRWPNGSLEKVPGVDADQLVVVQEGKGIIRRQSFTARRA